MINFSIREEVGWKKHGADYTLKYTFWKYDDPAEKEYGSGVKYLILTIKKKKHEWEISMDNLREGNKKELTTRAESSVEG